MNNDGKRFFFDPLYKAVIFQDPVSFRPRSAFATDGAVQGTRRLVTPLIDTFEFARLMRLRQAGLLYMVFPSATHTRFAHSLGCCHLGWAAMASIKIDDPDSGVNKPEILEKWLKTRKWQNEFLIALLCHDIGHFAFSHLIEGNEAINKILGFELKHEKVGCDLIWGRNISFEALSLLTHGLNNPIRLNVLLQESVKENELNFNLVCYLISGDEPYLTEMDEPQKRQARIIHALTSGLLDLDRIDHYRRDSEFMGLEIGFNYQALLHGLTVVGKKDGSGISLRIEKAAVGHALSLLHLRERLTVDCFFDDRSLSLGAMCTWAIERFLKIKDDGGEAPTTMLSYLFRGDDELLQLLLDSNDSGVNSMASRLAANQPFPLIGCYILDKYKEFKDVYKFLEQIDENYYNDPMVLCKVHPDIKKFPRNEEWLTLENLMDKEGKSLGKSGPYVNQIKHFWEDAHTEIRNVWFFAADSSRISELRDRIQEADLWKGGAVELPITAA